MKIETSLDLEPDLDQNPDLNLKADPKIVMKVIIIQIARVGPGLRIIIITIVVGPVKLAEIDIFRIDPFLTRTKLKKF